MAKKKPKVKANVVSEKVPKTAIDPAIYKALPACWQIASVDNGSRWGLSTLKDEFVFRNINLDSIVDTIDEGIGCALLEANGTTGETFGEILSKIFDTTRGNISTDHVPIIMDNIIGSNIFMTKIYPKLKHFETTSWEDIEREQYGNGKTKHHSVAIADIISEAQKRLIELRLDDVDQLFSLRLEGKIRIWGIRKYSFLRILWIDLKHEICPSDKD